MIALDLLRAGAVTAVAAPGLVLLRRAPGRVRHAAFAAALAASAVAPFASGLVPRRAVVVESSLPLPVLGRAPQASAPVRAAPDRRVPDRSGPVAPALGSFDAPGVPEPGGFPEGLLLLPGLVPLGRLALGWRTARRWAKRAAPGPDGTLLSPDAPTPLTFFDGAVHRVLLPAEAADWSAERLRIVLLHERAHVARGDWWTQTAARTVVAFQWMNPLAWWMLRGLTDAAEEAADQAALGHGIAPQTYARELLALAVPGPRPAGSLPMTPKSHVGRRIVSVLRAPRPAPRRTLVFAALAPFTLILPAGAIGQGIVVAQTHHVGLWNEAMESGFGTPANGWAARLPGLGEARLEYVVGWFGGTPRAWKPDGAPLPLAGLPIAPVRPAEARVYDAKLKRDVPSGRFEGGETMFVFGFDDPTGVAEAGVQSASSSGGPASKVFGRGSWTTTPGRPGRRYTAGFVAYGHGYAGVDGRLATTDAVGFAVGPVDATPIVAYDLTKGLSLKPAPFPGFESSGFAFQDGAKGAMDLVMTMAKVPNDPSMRPWLVAVAKGKDGRVDTESPILGHEGTSAVGRSFYRYSLPRPRGAYASFEILGGGTATTEFRGVALLPNAALRSEATRNVVARLSRARAALDEAEERFGKAAISSQAPLPGDPLTNLPPKIARLRVQADYWENQLALALASSAP